MRFRKSAGQQKSLRKFFCPGAFTRASKRPHGRAEIDFQRTESWPSKHTGWEWQALFEKSSKFKLSEEGFPPSISIKEFLVGPPLEASRTIEGLDGSEAPGGILAELAFPWIGGPDARRQAAGDGGSSEAIKESGKQAPGAVEEQEGKTAVSRGKHWSIDLEENKTGGLEGKPHSKGKKPDIGTIAERFQTALREAFPGMAEDHIDQISGRLKTSAH